MKYKQLVKSVLFLALPLTGCGQAQDATVALSETEGTSEMIVGIENYTQVDTLAITSSQSCDDFTLRSLDKDCDDCLAQYVLVGAGNCEPYSRELQFSTFHSNFILVNPVVSGDIQSGDQQ